ncbi:bacteriocin family protein [Leucobacter sp. CSA1]|uniref:Type 1 encapsulin shell protein n=1 Tax=Leucobacter chromiisoli TaxID=2796471 RepID=A0A934UUL1_9MICO|nr:family 1 encapsulin nanocompartment shell protein [Leucobacter chromiisoli]MBK0419614.1 bacteriocin family protein [Leucobacter chromiisoli]
MNHLLRGHAPITSDVWAMIDDEAKTRLTAALGARRLVDFSGPHGWEHSATSTGRVGPVVSAPSEGVIARARRVLPLAEVRADFVLSRDELESGTRGAPDVDFGPLDDAAKRIASVENAAIVDGWGELGMTGIAQASPHEPIPVGDDARRLAVRVAAAVAALKGAGVDGPYGLALGYELWVDAMGGNDAGGAPLLTHLTRILDGPVQWTPGITGAVVLSLRGGDFLFESGEDLSVGYAGHTAESVSLYLQETFSFRVATPEAAIALS